MRLLFALIALFFSAQLFAQVEPADTLRTSGDTLAITITIDSTILLTDTAYARKDTITIIGVGDIMMGTNYPDNRRLPPDSGAFLMKDVEHILQDADITFGNVEGVLLNEGGTPKSCKNPDVCYAFRSPTGYVKNLVRAGFDVVSLANNHAGDFGDAGRQSSMEVLDNAGIAHAGQATRPYVIFTRDSLRYGFMALAPNSGCVSLHDLAGACEIVQHLDSICDIVITSFHGGAEGAQYQHVPRKNELFYGEDRGDVYKLSRMLIDAGADIVFGHGPHVTRAVDLYKDRFIAYSLGNFCTYLGISISGVNGLAPIVKVYTSREGVFYKAEITPTYQTRHAGVQPDPDKRVVSVIRELTEKDFPESAMRIDDNGLITYLAQ